MLSRRPTRRFQPAVAELPLRIAPSDLPPIEVSPEVFEPTIPGPSEPPAPMDSGDPLTATVPTTTI